MESLTLLLIALLLIGAFILVTLLAPPLYAWADRWIDRTHQETASEDDK